MRREIVDKALTSMRGSRDRSGKGMKKARVGSGG